MLAVHLESGRVELRHQPLPRIPPGFARIRCSPPESAPPISNCSVAITDSAARPVTNSSAKWSAPMIHSWIGKRVAGEINLACGHCDWCHRGLGRHCPTRTVLGIVESSRRVSGIPHAAASESARRPEIDSRRTRRLHRARRRSLRNSRSGQDPKARARGRAGRWKARTADRPGPASPRRARCSCSAVIATNCTSPNAPASPRKSFAKNLPDARISDGRRRHRLPRRPARRDLDDACRAGPSS